MSTLQDIHKLIDQLQDSVRQECKEDVCMYCGGRSPQYFKRAVGPNDAGNWVHNPVTGYAGQTVLCKASAIFARERYPI